MEDAPNANDSVHVSSRLKQLSPTDCGFLYKLIVSTDLLSKSIDDKIDSWKTVTITVE